MTRCERLKELCATLLSSLRGFRELRECAFLFRSLSSFSCALELDVERVFVRVITQDLKGCSTNPWGARLECHLEPYDVSGGQGGFNHLLAPSVR